MAVTNQSVNSLVPGGTNSMPTPINTSPVVFGANNPYLTNQLPTSGGTVTNTNPYTSAVPGTSNAIGATPGSTIPTPQVGTNSLSNDALKGTFGDFAPAIQQLLQSQGGYNPQVIQAILAQMGPGIAKGQQNLVEEFGAAGNRFSSSAATGLGDYNSQVQLDQGQIMAQLYEQSYQNYMNEVMGVGGEISQYEMNKPSGWDIASGILGAGTSLLTAKGI